MLMRRLRARIPSPHNVQYILTSATLGGKDADGDIVAFAHSLCGVDLVFTHCRKKRKEGAICPIMNDSLNRISSPS